MLLAKGIVTISRKDIVTISRQGIRNYRVTLLGAASELGQTISLLLRAQPSIEQLVIHDHLQHTPGILMDVSHVPSESKVEGYAGDDTLDRALSKSDLVIAAGGISKQPGLSEKTWFTQNTDFIKRISPKIAKIEPFPFVGIVTEPINTVVPMAAEIMKNHGNYNPRKMFGITTIDSLRAQSMYAIDNCINPRECVVPVIGGRSEGTAIPLLSQAKPKIALRDQYVQEFTSRLRKSDDLVTTAKNGWSPTLSIAFGVLIFVRNILDALGDSQGKITALVENNDFGTCFFSGLVNVTKNGINDMHRYTNLSEYECYILENSIKQLRKDIEKGKKILEYS